MTTVKHCDSGPATSFAVVVSREGGLQEPRFSAPTKHYRTQETECNTLGMAQLLPFGACNFITKHINTTLGPKHGGLNLIL